MRDLADVLTGGVERTIHCPNEIHAPRTGHEDNTPSLRIYPGHGAHCFGCGFTCQDAVGWVMAVSGVTYRRALEMVALDDIPKGTPPRTRHAPFRAVRESVPKQFYGMTDIDIVTVGQRGLTTKAMQYYENRCISAKMVYDWWLGYAHGWFVIPVRAVTGEIVCVKLRRDDAVYGDTVPRYWQSQPGTFVFNPVAITVAQLTDKPLIVCEGEFDCIVSNEVFPTVTTTAGVASLGHLLGYVGDAHVVSALDVGQRPLSWARSVVQWPEFAGKDITDYVKEFGLEAYRRLVQHRANL